MRIVDPPKRYVDRDFVQHGIHFQASVAIPELFEYEDGIKKGLLSWDQVEDQLKTRCKDCAALNNALKRTHAQIDSARLKGKALDNAMAQAFRTHAIGEAVPSAVNVFVQHYDLIMKGRYHRELIADPTCSARPIVRACKGILKDEVYRDYDILRLEIMGRTVIHDLMDLFWEAARSFKPGELKTATYPEKIYLLISENYRRVFEDSLQHVLKIRS